MGKHVQRIEPRMKTRHNAVSAPNCTECEDGPDDCPKLAAVKAQARRIAENSLKTGWPLEVWWVKIGDNYEVRSKPLRVAA